MEASPESEAGDSQAGYASLHLECSDGDSQEALSEALWRIRDGVAATNGRSLLIYGTGAGFVSTSAATTGITRSLLVDACSTIAQHPAPVVAAADAPLLGAGLEVALACDLRFAKPGVKVGFPGVARGFLPCGGIQRLVAIGGISLATRLALLDETPVCGVDQALNRVFTVAGDARASAADALDRASAGAPLAVEAIKASLRAAQELSLVGGLAVEADLACLLLPTSDRAEGIDALLARRPPTFKGK